MKREIPLLLAFSSSLVFPRWCRLHMAIRFRRGMKVQQRNRSSSFVTSSDKKGGADFVPPMDRIAVFDNDGTLWLEQPLPFQACFVMDRVRSLAPQHPEWKEKQPFKAVLGE